MAKTKSGIGPGRRLEVGAAILAAAKVIDTRPIKTRLAAFERAHRAYASAQHKVDVAEAQLVAARAGIGDCDAEQNKAVEALAHALVVDGQSRLTPFAAFGAPTPAAIIGQRRKQADKAIAIHTLVTAVMRSKSASKPTLAAAQTADKAARAAEQALAPIDTLQAGVRDARNGRDALGTHWDAALLVLKHAALSASDDGAPQLYAALFDRAARPNGKNGKPAPTPAASDTPQAAPQPAAATTA